MRNRRRAVDAVIYIFLILLCILWLLPFFWLHRAVMKFVKSPKVVWHHIKLAFGKGENHG